MARGITLAVRKHIVCLRSSKVKKQARGSVVLLSFRMAGDKREGLGLTMGFRSCRMRGECNRVQVVLASSQIRLWPGSAWVPTSPSKAMVC